MFLSALVRGVALAVLLGPSVGLAQPAPTAQLPQHPRQLPRLRLRRRPHNRHRPHLPLPPKLTVDQRIRALQSQLGITDAQMPLWTAFAQAIATMRRAQMRCLPNARTASHRMSAVDNMHSYAQIARAYADNTERLATAFYSLYASLTDVAEAGRRHAVPTAGGRCLPAANSALERCTALSHLTLRGKRRDYRKRGRRGPRRQSWAGNARWRTGKTRRTERYKRAMKSRDETRCQSRDPQI